MLLPFGKGCSFTDAEKKRNFAIDIQRMRNFWYLTCLASIEIVRKTVKLIKKPRNVQHIQKSWSEALARTDVFIYFQMMCALVVVVCVIVYRFTDGATILLPAL